MKKSLSACLFLILNVLVSVAFAQTKTPHHHAHHSSGLSKKHKSSHHHSAALSKNHTHTLHHNINHDAHHHTRPSHLQHHHLHYAHPTQALHVDDSNIKITPDQSKALNMENDDILQQKLPTPAAFQIQDTNENNDQTLDADTTPALTSSDAPQVLSTRERLVGLVHEAIERLHHTSYRMGGSYFDLSRGVYEGDCSGYVDQLLNRAEPEAYKTLTQWTHSNKPNSFDYYDFFKKLPDSSWHFWQKIKDVASLKPGAILVFRYHGHSRYGSGGHVMVVMSEPVPVESQSDTFLVRVSDSANSGHSDDTRSRHMSGVGIGTLLLKVNPLSHEPNAYAWKLSGWLEHADVAMAEPVTPA